MQVEDYNAENDDSDDDQDAKPIGKKTYSSSGGEKKNEIPDKI